MGDTCLHKLQKSETSNVLAAMKRKGAENVNRCLQLQAGLLVKHKVNMIVATEARKVPGDTIDAGSHATAFCWDLKM